MQTTMDNSIMHVPKKFKRLTKLRDADFTIPHFSEYKQFRNINYPVSFLKQICKNYKLRVGGNKPQLKARIYALLYETSQALVIQKMYKGYLLRLYHKLIGPAFKDRSLCTNDTDFFSLESIKKIPVYEFFSYRREDSIWGFNILSIYNLFVKTSSGVVLNPYTRDKLDNRLFADIKRLLRLAKIFNRSINVVLNNSSNTVSSQKRNEIKCLELFQYINELGNYSDHMWFMSLSRVDLCRFIRELADIWEYRAQVSLEVKREICSPYGNPFRYINLNQASSLGYISLQKSCLQIIEQFVTRGSTQDYRVLGASYVLCGLTLVSHEAAVALPWLYQSVSGTG
jgi:hypothetical protein